MESIQPLVSVIIPCYNSEKYLQETLDSVFRQTYSNIEIICVDNGSSDGTIDIIKKNQTEYTDLFFFKEPQKGAPKARNLGLEKSRGKYIQFLDSDDTITLNKIESQVIYAEENNFDVVISDRIVKDEKLEKNIEELTFSDVVDHPLETAFSQIIITGNPIYSKTSVLKINGYRENLPSAQDWDFHIRLFMTNVKIGYLKGDYLISRSVSDSLSSNWIEVGEVACKLTTDYYPAFKELGLDKSEKIRDKIVNSFFVSAVYADSKKKAKEFIKQIYLWMESEEILEHLTEKNRFLAKVVGLNGAVTIKRLFRKLST